MSGSGQFPGSYNNPVGAGHRGNFPNQMVNMTMVQNPMGMMAYNQTGIISQQQKTQMQNTSMGIAGQGLAHGSAGMQSPSHAQQQITQQTLAQQQISQQALTQQQMQQQQQLQQQPQLTLQTPSTPTPGTTMVTQQAMQQQQQQAGMVASTSQQTKEINIACLCRLGTETVQDITSRFQEIFSALKTIQPSSCNTTTNAEKKVQEYFRTIRLLFKRLRIIYEKSNDGCSQGMEYTHVESLIPYKDETDHRTEHAQCEEYKKVLQENRELAETVTHKNKQLRDIIDRTRIIIWEINTMLNMRRS